MNMNNWLHKNDNFEELLKSEAEDYRVYPSDKLWGNIQKELHGETKWPSLIFIFSIVVLALAVTTVMNYPPQKFIVKSNTAKLSEKAVVKSSNKSTDATNTTRITEKATASQPFNHFVNTSGVAITSLHITKGIVQDEIESTTAENFEIIQPSTENIATTAGNSSSLNNNSNIKKVEEAVEANNSSQPLTALSKETTALKQSDDANNYLNNLSNKAIVKKQPASKWAVQYYATISNSYRTLEDDKSRLPFISNAAERQKMQANVNDVVKERPAAGGEFGVSFLRQLSKHFFIKTGLQFNIRQYGIDAYKANGDATIKYVENNQLNSLSIKSAYSTQSGTNAVSLRNQLFQISVPIGLQWDFVNGERWGITAAATIQPTLTLNKNVYVVSTDYQYYADGTTFFRRLNVNTSSEICLTLKSKNVKWFFGPQIRYQQMPTFNDIYPIKEHRIDYGIKFGFVKSL